jgi:adenylyltransferase/sulfurtransferase
MEARLRELEAENARLRAELAGTRGGDARGSAPPPAPPPTAAAAPAAPAAWDAAGHGLSRDEVCRYSRQAILPAFGPTAQARLCRGSVLVVGAGGLGSPAALYLVAAGVGRLGVVDRDAVELSNLHRQVIHGEASVGAHKADSAAAALRALNSSVAVEPHRGGLTPANAVALVRAYDVIVDATDNAPTRYLLSDACAVARRPLVSGAAIGADGQLSVYCAGGDCPCYRCLFPEPPAAGNCARCADAGVLGPVPGVVGALQALEAIKILAGVGAPLARRLLALDFMAPRFHLVKLRPRAAGCAACGDAPTITEASLPAYDYAAFTGQAPSDGPPPPLTLLRPGERRAPAELAALLKEGAPLVLLDVRPAEQFALAALPGALNCPFQKLDAHLPVIRAALAAAGGVAGAAPPALVVVCRRGNDSQRAVAALRGEPAAAHAVDLAGGMEAWAREADAEFPLY